MCASSYLPTRSATSAASGRSAPSFASHSKVSLNFECVGLSPERGTVREEVLGLDDKQATIEVRAARGKEERRWTQIAPAGNDARWNNAVDEIKDLPNPDDATLARLWEWVVFPAEGTPAK